MAAPSCCRCGSSSFLRQPSSSRPPNGLLATVPFSRFGRSVRLDTFFRPLSISNGKSPHCRRFNNFISAVPAAVAATAAVEAKPIQLTYLEGNSWLWNLGGVNILVDPVLVGNLDFGLPSLYDAAKKVVKNFRLEDLPELDCLLITQGLDDHCHRKTLRPLSQMLPDLRVVSARSAEPILSTLFENVTYIEPGQSFEFEGKNRGKVYIRATAGPILGPPWQRPENGYVVAAENCQSIYLEPHCVYDRSSVEKEQADIVITPVIKQLLPSFLLVSGQEDAVSLTKLLKAKFVVPMNNGDLDAKGILSSLLRQDGTVESFKQLLSSELPGVQVLEPTPGKPLNIPVNLEVAS